MARHFGLGRRKRRKFAVGKNAIAISDRDGCQYPYREMVYEPGTKLWVHRSESDEMWNRVDHPQNYPADVAEAIALKRPSVDPNKNPNFIFVDGDSVFIVENNGPIYELDGNFNN